MGKKKKMSIIVTIITLILIITVSTTALWKWTSSNTNVGFTISGLDAFIIYNKGSDVLTGVLDPVSSYSDSSVSTEITLYKNTSKTLYGHIYLDVTTIGTNIREEDAVKWAITSNGKVLNEGNFVGSSVDTSIPLKINIPLSTTEQKFQIYIWLDKNMDINDAIEGEVLSTKVRAEASEYTYTDVIDTSGSNIVSGTFKPVESYTESSVNAEIKLVNNTNEQLYGDIYLETSNIPNNVMSEPSAKWTLTSSNVVINEGNLTDSKNEEVITLATDVPITADEKTYKVYLWVDKNVSNSSSLDGVLLETAIKTEVRKQNLDISGANKPELTKGLIPVAYKNNKWVKADKTNSDVNNQWYDYNKKEWANAVLVSSAYRDANNNDTFNIGDEIPESAILAYYVWIPRYKYKVWNINKVIGTDSYNAKDSGIDIVFEKTKETTGTIKCTAYSFDSPSSNANSPNETCSGSNGEYYTHPAFWWDMDGDSVRESNEEIKGMWVGKYELSSSTPTSSDGGGESTTLTVRIKPNVSSWRNNKLLNYSYVIQDMQKSNNEYGLVTDKTKVDSHMIKNLEWGAVAYLTHSKYGRCNGSSCEEVTVNNSSDYITGNAANEVDGTSASGTVNAYNTLAGQKASTTGNIYGIYDMNGGGMEFVMGNISDSSGSYEYDYSDENFTFSTQTVKYIDMYAKGTLSTGQRSSNRARLGDATGEVVISSKTANVTTWNQDTGNFAYSLAQWFGRGSYHIGTETSGIFFYYHLTKAKYTTYSTRAILINLS